MDRGIVYDLNDLLVNPSAAAALPFAAYDIDNFGRIVGNHHVLEPIYQQIRPGSPLALPSALGQTFGFAYWLSRVDGGACSAGASELELQVRFDTPDQEPGEWTTAGHVRQCGSFRDWESVWVSVPSGVRGQNGFVQVRVREIGPVTGATLHLRHFTMQ